jgi:hypothetical protein
MKNKEQLLYFFLQGAISLSQYDYKFMANLQTMIQNNFRVTSNQAALFDKLISKYSKQLTKNGYVKEELKSLPWKTLIVESTSEYTGALVSMIDDLLTIRVPFNKQFISQFRTVKDNKFEWSRDSKHYTAPFSTSALKIAATILPKFFDSVKYSSELQEIVNELEKLNDLVWNPTLSMVNGRLLVAATNPVLGQLIDNIELSLTPKTLFKMSQLHIKVDPKLYENDEKLKFAASKFYTTDIDDCEHTISWMRNIGCENVILGRGIRSASWRTELSELISKYGMNPLGPLSFGKIPDGLSMMIQHTSSVEVHSAFSGQISKTIVITDSRPIEVL